jgi:hypothetical protein
MKKNKMTVFHIIVCHFVLFHLAIWLSVRSVFHIIVCHFVLFHLAIWLSVRSVFHFIVCHFVLFHLAIWWSVRLLFTSCGIFKPIPFHFQLKIKNYAPSQGKRSIFYILAWKFE